MEPGGEGPRVSGPATTVKLRKSAMPRPEQGILRKEMIRSVRHRGFRPENERFQGGIQAPSQGNTDQDRAFIFLALPFMNTIERRIKWWSNAGYAVCCLKSMLSGTRITRKSLPP